MDATTEAEFAAGFDLIPRTRVATCRRCSCVVAGTHLGPTCPNGHEWTVRDADDLGADPELRRLAAGFELPSYEDAERIGIKRVAAERLRRRDEA